MLSNILLDVNKIINLRNIKYLIQTENAPSKSWKDYKGALLIVDEWVNPLKHQVEAGFKIEI